MSESDPQAHERHWFYGIRPATFDYAVLGFWGEPMRRRDFVTLLCGTAAWSSIANAQRHQAGPPLIGVLWPWKPPSPIWLSNSKALSEGLEEEGYTEGRNIKTE